MLILTAIAAPLIAPYGYEETDIQHKLAGPGSPGHLLGTDLLGRDILSRLIYGLRTALTVAFGAELTALVLALVIGLLAGYLGGRVESLLMAFTDVMYAFPSYLFAVVMVTVLGRSIFALVVAIGIASWVTQARLVRAQVMTLKEREYVEAARSMGAKGSTIAIRYILPNAIGPILVTTSFAIPAAIAAEAGLALLRSRRTAADPVLGRDDQRGQPVPAGGAAHAGRAGGAVRPYPAGVHVDRRRRTGCFRSEWRAAMSEEALLSVRELRTTFRRDGAEPLTAVDGVSFDVRRGQALAIVGESGSGKSVTMRSVMGILPRTARITGGQALFGGRDLLAIGDKELRKVRGRDIAMVFQSAMEAMNPTLTLERQLTEHLLWHGICNKAEARKRAVRALGDVGIPDPEKRIRTYPFQLSGGMRQRAMIAMAMVTEPALLIADEPTTAVDVTVQRQILDLLAELKNRGTGVIMITHDLGVARYFCDDAVVMYAGRVVERAPMAAVARRPAPSVQRRPARVGRRGRRSGPAVARRSRAVHPTCPIVPRAARSIRGVRRPNCPGVGRSKRF